MGAVVYKMGGRQVTPQEFQGDPEAAAARFQAMVQAARPPSCNTDREFLMGHCNGSQFQGQEQAGDHYRQVAEAGGQNTTGKVYVSGLARYPGDPEAWVSGKGDVERVLDARGWGCQGLVKREVTNVGQPDPASVDPQLIHEEVEEICRAVDDDGSVDREDLAEQVFERRKPHWVKESFEPEKHLAPAEVAHVGTESL